MSLGKPENLHMDGQIEKKNDDTTIPQTRTQTDVSPAKSAIGELQLDNPVLREFLELFPGFAAVLDKKFAILMTNVRFQRYFSAPTPDRRKDKTPEETHVENGWKALLDNLAFDRRTRSFIFHPGRLFYLCYSRMLSIAGSEVLLVHGMNVTELIKVGQQLGVDEHAYRDLSVNLSMGLALVDADLKVMRSNRKFETWLGKPDETPEAFCRAMHKECSLSGDCQDCPILRCLKTKANAELEFSRLDDNGAEQFIRMTACPVPNGKEPPKHAMVVLEDVTRQRILRDKLMRAQRLEALGTMAGGIAHEINQPLSAVSLYVSGLQMLLQKGQTPSRENLADRCELILQQVQNIRDIVNGMLKLVAHEEIQLTAVNLRDAMEHAMISLAEDIGRHNAKVENFIPADLPGVRAVPMQMEQIFVNMLKNSLNEVPKKGALIRATATLQGNSMRVCFADNGGGISPSLLDKVFDPFFTTKGPDAGRGLGLSIVHAFIKAWGGNISVRGKCQDLGGAEFVLDLLLADPELS